MRIALECKKGERTAVFVCPRSAFDMNRKSGVGVLCVVFVVVAASAGEGCNAERATDGPLTLASSAAERATDDAGPPMESGDGKETEETSPPVCAPGMILVEGMYCTQVEQPCVKWMEDPALYSYARCAVFAKQSVCKGEQIPLRFCIDRLEAADSSGIPNGMCREPSG
jgi:hypothetical protein